MSRIGPEFTGSGAVPAGRPAVARNWGPILDIADEHERRWERWGEGVYPVVARMRSNVTMPIRCMAGLVWT